MALVPTARLAHCEPHHLAQGAVGQHLAQVQPSAAGRKLSALANTLDVRTCTYVYVYVYSVCIYIYIYTYSVHIV